MAPNCIVDACSDFGSLDQLLARATERCLQTNPLLLPPGVLSAQLGFESLDLAPDLRHLLCVCLSRCIEHASRLIDGTLPAFALLLPSSFFSLTFSPATVLFLCVGRSSFPICSRVRDPFRLFCRSAPRLPTSIRSRPR